MNEKKVYAVLCDDLEKSYHEYSDEEFKKIAENIGEVYDIDEFVANFNDDWNCPSSDTHYILIA